MTDQNSTIITEQGEDIAVLKADLDGGIEKARLAAISGLAGAGFEGLTVLMDFLKADRSVNPVTGKVYRMLYTSGDDRARNFLSENFPAGIVPLKSDRGVDYRLLQEFLAGGDFQTADAITRQKLCELAGEGAIRRKWVYFTEVESFPNTDLETIDTLWRVYSEGKFGFSVQRKIWLSVGRDFPKLWPKIGWKNGNSWTKFPNEFIWDLGAPVGHLPLLNQLRGARVAASLYAHPVWTTIDNR